MSATEKSAGGVRRESRDDSDLAEPLGLTTVHQPLEESGRVATEMLIGQLREPSGSARQTTLSVSLVERGTA
jgi:DNA-binding LacI/PurR family transcriptional regulator